MNLTWTLYSTTRGTGAVRRSTVVESRSISGEGVGSELAYAYRDSLRNRAQQEADRTGLTHEYEIRWWITGQPGSSVVGSCQPGPRYAFEVVS